MAYRSSHYRRGYYRRTPSGGYTWVSPTVVSAYEYVPGSPTFLGRMPNIIYLDNQKPLSEINKNSDHTTLWSGIKEEDREKVYKMALEQGKTWQEVVGYKLIDGIIL